MSIVVRAVDVGFGNTKYVTASAQGQVDCAHLLHSWPTRTGTRFRSIRWRQAPYWVQVPVDGLISTRSARRRVRRGQVPFAPAARRHIPDGRVPALVTGALHFMKVETVDLLVVGLPVSQYTSKRAALAEGDDRHFPRRPQSNGSVKRALVAAAPGRALTGAQQNLNVGSPGHMSLVMDVGSRTFDWLVTRGMRVRSSHERLVTRVSPTFSRYIADTVGARMKEDFRDLDAVDRAPRSGNPAAQHRLTMTWKKFDTAIHKIGRSDAIRVLTWSGGIIWKEGITRASSCSASSTSGKQPELFRADGGSEQRGVGVGGKSDRGPKRRRSGIKLTISREEHPASRSGAGRHPQSTAQDREAGNWSSRH